MGGMLVASAGAALREGAEEKEEGAAGGVQVSRGGGVRGCSRDEGGVLRKEGCKRHECTTQRRG